MPMEDLTVYRDITVSRGSLHEQIADRIQAFIVERRINPGARIPSDRALAKTLNVSRPTVRAALHLLQHRGLVLIKPGSGTYVTSLGSAPIIESVERFFSVKDCSFDDLMQVRELIEPGAAALAAANATLEDIEVLERKVEALELAFETGGPRELALADSEFHTVVGNASHNPLLAAIAASITHLVRDWTEESSTKGFVPEVNRTHRMIFQAIVERNPEEARKASLSHTSLAREVLSSLAHEQ